MKLSLAAVAAFLLIAVGGQAATITVQPGQSWDAAYQAANPGDTIVLAAGSHPNQTVRADPDKPVGSAPVTFQPAAGATVTVNDLATYANDVVYRDFRLPTGRSDGTGEFTIRGGQNVTGERLTGTKPYMWCNTTRCVNIRIIDGNWGPHVSTGGGFQITRDLVPKDVLLQGNTFHDFTVPAGSTAHLDCVHVFAAENLRIIDNTFRNCQHFAILLNARPQGSLNGREDYLVEGNDLEGGIYGLKLRGDSSPSVEQFEGVTIRNNVSDGISLGSAGSNTLREVVVTGNVVSGELGPCREGVVFADNTPSGCDNSEPPPPPPPPPVACADGVDNDSDGLVDLADPGCVDAADTDEFDAPPPPPPTVCDQACVDAYEAEIAALEAANAALEGANAGLRAERDALLAKIAAAKAALE